jgi:hypothetical protein
MDDILSIIGTFRCCIVAKKYYDLVFDKHRVTKFKICRKFIELNEPKKLFKYDRIHSFLFILAAALDRAYIVSYYATAFDSQVLADGRSQTCHYGIFLILSNLIADNAKPSETLIHNMICKKKYSELNIILNTNLSKKWPGHNMQNLKEIAFSFCINKGNIVAFRKLYKPVDIEIIMVLLNNDRCDNVLYFILENIDNKCISELLTLLYNSNYEQLRKSRMMSEIFWLVENSRNPEIYRKAISNDIVQKIILTYKN